MGYHGVLVCFRHGPTPDMPWVEVADFYMGITSLYNIHQIVQERFPWLRLVKPMEIWRTVYPAYASSGASAEKGRGAPSPCVSPIGFEFECYPDEYVKLGDDSKGRHMEMIHEYHPKELGPFATRLRKAVIVLPLSEVLPPVLKSTLSAPSNSAKAANAHRTLLEEGGTVPCPSSPSQSADLLSITEADTALPPLPTVNVERDTCLLPPPIYMSEFIDRWAVKEGFVPGERYRELRKPWEGTAHFLKEQDIDGDIPVAMTLHPSCDIRSLERRVPEGHVSSLIKRRETVSSTLREALDSDRHGYYPSPSVAERLEAFLEDPELACIDSCLPIEAVEPVFTRFHQYKESPKTSDLLRQSVEQVISSCVAVRASGDESLGDTGAGESRSDTEADLYAKVIASMRGAVSVCASLCGGEGPRVGVVPSMRAQTRDWSETVHAGPSGQLVIGGPDDPRERAVRRGLKIHRDSRAYATGYYNQWLVCSVDGEKLTVSGYAFKDRIYGGTLASLPLNEETCPRQLAAVLYALVACCTEIVGETYQRHIWEVDPHHCQYLFPSIAIRASQTSSGSQDEPFHPIELDNSPCVGVYRGATDRGRVLVRVSKNYNVVAHQLLARATPQAAPTIYSSEPLYPGSEYRVIVMEDL
ncbi:hypothetical protein KIPB_010590, partial [Kipferlia bialata]|eukprot:g10590.t1